MSTSTPKVSIRRRVTIALHFLQTSLATTDRPAPKARFLSWPIASTRTQPHLHTIEWNEWAKDCFGAALCPRQPSRHYHRQTLHGSSLEAPLRFKQTGQAQHWAILQIKTIRILTLSW